MGNDKQLNQLPRSRKQIGLVSNWGQSVYVLASVALMLFGTGLKISAAETTDNNQRDVTPAVTSRFSDTNTEEIPDFQKHVVPLLSRLGCNGRACHGSFQGRGGFQLSLFGYDFEADHQSLMSPDRFRVDLELPTDSLILQKPTDESSHEGGKRFDDQGWEYELLLNWIEAGATKPASLHQLANLRVEPSEIVFDYDSPESISLRIVAEWQDGTVEDVTPLSRFVTNDGAVAEVDRDGRVSSEGSGLTHIVVAYDKAVVTVPVIRPFANQGYDKVPEDWIPTEVDSHVVQLLQKLAIQPSDLADDATFLRRVSLDVTGTLPTPEEVAVFLNDQNPDKRSKKIDELLERPAYAAWWTTFLCDLTGNGTSQLTNALPKRGLANQVWYDWIYQRVDENVPYDQLISGIVIGQNREPSESFYDYSTRMCEIYSGNSETTPADLDSMPYFWARQDLREVENRAISFAYAFMGVRIQCAQCHKHPFDQWSKQDFEEFSSFFATVNYDQLGRNQEDRRDAERLIKQLGIEGQRNQLRRDLSRRFSNGDTVPFPQIVIGEVQRRRPQRQPRTATLLGGETFDLSEMDDPRQAVMDWMLKEDNPYFARAFVNRVWARYFGVGIVEPADDLSLGNPPNNEPLLAYLEQGFRESGYDMRWLHREILNSRTYQLSWKTNESNKLDERHFSHALPRRLPAEVLVDVMTQASASSDRNREFAFELDSRAIAIPGTPQVRGNRGAGYALSIFGKSDRMANCDCERSDDVSLIQTLYLRNDNALNQLISRSEDGWLSELNRSFAKSEESSDLQQQLERSRRQLAEIERRLQQLEKRGARPQRQLQANRQAQRLARTVEQVEQQIDEDAAVRRVSFDREQLVEEAYLRTLSRFPSEDETKRMSTYLTEAPSPLEGMRDVLWALLNTKEFLVNH